MMLNENNLNELQSLLGGPASWETVTADQLAEPYRSLLAHDRHMTVTLEKHWGAPVEVHLLHCEQRDNRYARRIYLTEANGGQHVEYGAVILDLNACTDEVRAEILSQKIPLGRILIQHNILTNIDCHEFARIRPGAKMCSEFGLDPTDTLYGRYATISFNDKPAMALIEVMPANLETQE